MRRLIFLLTLVATPALASPVDVYCDPQWFRVLGVVARDADPPPLVGPIKRSIQKDSADPDLVALSGVPQAEWMCLPDLSGVRRMTAQEIATLAPAGDDAKRRARAYLRSPDGLALAAVTRVLVARLCAAQPQPAQCRQQVRDEILAAIDGWTPEDRQ